MKKSIQMHDNDTVATVLDDISIGNAVNVFNGENNLLFQIDALTHIPHGNKIALKDIEQGSYVIKYGKVIGKAVKDIKKGELVHVQNVKSLVVDIPANIKKEILRQMNIN
ncbi:altronate dehydratase [Desulfitispora alkaliphila]|uniref:UxaA family hydrolase n=1 Tax=Desulfitispora alkaliphila TaxID=622674 RepID=UPI003D19E0C5